MTSIRYFILTVFCLLFLSTVAMGMGNRPNLFFGEDPKQVVIGEILHIEDERYLVQDSYGNEVNLHVDHSSQVAGRLKKGDRIVAQVSEDGHVLKVQVADVTNVF